LLLVLVVRVLPLHPLQDQMAVHQAYFPYPQQVVAAQALDQQVRLTAAVRVADQTAIKAAHPELELLGKVLQVVLETL
jgi:hypothetical protein